MLSILLFSSNWSYYNNKTHSELGGKTYIVTSTIAAISTKSILAAAIEGPLSVIADCMETTVVCFDGTLVDI